jgi:hypothetical protein
MELTLLGSVRAMAWSERNGIAKPAASPALSRLRRVVFIRTLGGKKGNQKNFLIALANYSRPSGMQMQLARGNMCFPESLKRLRAVIYRFYRCPFRLAMV